ncbi:MAG TPA: hypothetical protein VFC78_17520 [Tepidisphaeraceae bacterium]|nr:hypothetical protein [Tepidisphaeraceae bacterium]
MPLHQNTARPASTIAPNGQPTKADLLAAWQVLENLSVSLHRIGSAFASLPGQNQDPATRQAMLEALDSYLSPELQRSTEQARQRLGSYLSDEEAEEFTEHVISYWNDTQRRPQ